MSLIIALKGFECLLLASDTRMTEGYTLEGPKTRDDSQKFLSLGEHLAVLTYGLTEVGYTGITSLKDEVSKNAVQKITFPSVIEIGERTFKRVSSEWSSANQEIPRRDRDVGFVIAGYDMEKDWLRIFNFQSPDFLPKEAGSGVLLAGQWHVAKFFIRKLYKGDMSLEKLKHLSVFLLDSTMTVYKTVGGNIKLATVTKPCGFKWVTEEEVASIRLKNTTFSSFFQERFYSSLMSALNSAKE